MTEPLLSVSGLAVRVRGLQILRGVSFEVGRGEAVGLVGETGSGKTMTVRAITGLLHPIGGEVSAGQIRLDGADVTSTDPRAWRRWQGRTVALVPQASLSSLSPVRRVRSQLAEAIRRADPSADIKRETRDLLAAVHLDPTPDLLASFAHELSGGMRQRVMIALALAVRPLLLVADEPTTALDAAIRSSVLGLFAEMRRTRGLGLVIVSHDIGAIAASTDRIVVMYGGQSVERGPTAEVIASPAHPYTAALLAAMPRSSSPGVRLPTLPGQPPRPQELGRGCAFATRCPQAFDACIERTPALRASGSDRDLACHLYDAQPVSVAEKARR